MSQIVKSLSQYLRARPRAPRPARLPCDLTTTLVNWLLIIVIAYLTWPIWLFAGLMILGVAKLGLTATRANSNHGNAVHLQLPA